MVSVGDICTVSQFGACLWVAKEPLPDNRWRLTCLQVDSRGRAAYQNRDAGIGDVTLIHDAETYEVGSTLTYEGLDHIVLEDQGHAVELGVPEHTSQTKGTELVRIPAGDVRVISKADLALAAIVAMKKE